MQVRWTLHALDNLNDAVEYIDADNLQASAEVAQEVLTNMRLQHNPPRFAFRM